MTKHHTATKADNKNEEAQKIQKIKNEQNVK